jgi:Domain of unknown function (DUF222)/HNH endonuclease
MCDSVSDLIDAVRRLVLSLDPTRVRANDAIALVEQFATLERLVAAGRTLAAGRVAETRAWRARGATSARAFVAQRSGTTLKDAAATLQTAAAIERLPDMRDALVAGKLSSAQAAEIGAAGSADPSAVASLLVLAERESLEALRERCRNVAAAAVGDADATERIRRSRHLRHWTEADGAVRLDGRLAADDAAPLLAVIRERADALLGEARRSGRGVERFDAYAADALCSLVREDACAKTVVNVVVSAGALERGTTLAGETSRIPGVGPVSVSAARRLAARGSVKVLERNGIDVRLVAHAGRTIPATLRTALERRDSTCVVPGCNRSRGLEIDHVVPLSEGGITTIANLARLCRWHHAQKTHHRWRLSGEPGGWQWARGPHREYPRRE